MNETGWRATGGRSRIVGLALATAAFLACANPVLAKDHPGKGLIQAAPKAEQKALKKQAQALRKQQRVAAKQQPVAGKPQRAAAKPRASAPRRASGGGAG